MLRSRSARNLLIQAALWAPSMAERDIILEALAVFPDHSETTPPRWPGQAAPEYQLSSAQPVVRRSETGPPPWWVVGTMARVPHETIDHPLHTKSATISLYHITSLTILPSNFSTATFSLKTFRPPPAVRHDSTLGPPH